MRTPGRCSFAFSLAAALAGASPAVAAARPAPRIEVAVSVYPLALIAREIGGGRVRVTTLVPPGASPHTFEPLPGDLVRLARARLFLRVGGGFDDWSAALVAAAGRGLEATALLEIAVRGRDAGALPAAAGGDPHVWLDPLLVRDVLAPALARTLAAVDRGDAEGYRARSRAFAARLTRLDRDVRAELAGAPGRAFVAFHNAWRHFARRYGLVEIAVVNEFAGDEPTPRELAGLIDAARRAGVPAILVEPQLDPRIARTIASEFGATTVRVDPLGDPRDPQRAGYEKLMRFNARAFARALGRGDT